MGVTTGVYWTVLKDGLLEEHHIYVKMHDLEQWKSSGYGVIKCLLKTDFKRQA